ncbi:hypothetical protein IWQ60_004116 [Tieghemiomyces parasiticus]|uniref:Uncharacterized protein n=1 Tax=Tieghemiomyces parasiticus TaxID=78921 RepID=A0A9W8AEX1_9FUNG|nr:hypothetical protein IWQ60_004116 [Tieghemiomyces parasiticus]
MRVLAIDALAVGLTYVMVTPVKSSLPLTNLPLEEILYVDEAINATMVPVDATVRLDGPATDQLTTLLMPKLTPFVRTVGSYWLTRVMLGLHYGITPLGDTYRVHGYPSKYLNLWVEPDPDHVFVIEQGHIDEYELHTGRANSRPAVQKLDEAKPDLKAINDAITVIPFEEAQRFTKVGDDSTFLHFALAHGYHRILFDVTRVLLDGGFQESLRDTIRSGDIVPLCLTPSQLFWLLSARGYGLFGHSVIPHSEIT